MKLWLVSLASCLDLGLAMVSFMFVAFAGGGFANNSSISKATIRIFDACMFVIPAFCVLASIMLFVGYWSGWGAKTYWWTISPIPVLIVFYFWMSKVG
jgi:hypothetical protein